MSDKKPTTFSRWYDNHKEEYNRKRRERYAKDPEYKKKQLENVHAQRGGTPKARPTKPEGTMTVRELAAKLDCSTDSLKWHGTRGDIPWPEMGDYPARLFTAEQVATITQFYKDK